MVAWQQASVAWGVGCMGNESWTKRSFATRHLYRSGVLRQHCPVAWIPMFHDDVVDELVSVG